ncbi:glyoxalase superfamily protein [Anseongella ginsenosidimutans]
MTKNRKYKYNRQGIEQASWNAPCIQVHDPFGNTLLFPEKAKK